MEEFTLTSEQIRAARMLLRWLQKDLAAKSGISLPVVKRIESEPGRVWAWQSTIDAFRRAFEKEGILFVDGQYLGAVLRQNHGEDDTGRRKSPKSRLKRAKALKAVLKRRPTQPKRLK